MEMKRLWPLCGGCFTPDWKTLQVDYLERWFGCIVCLFAFSLDGTLSCKLQQQTFDGANPRDKPALRAAGL